MTVFFKRTVKRRSLILPLGSGADLQSGSEQMCAPIQADTCVHTCHTAAMDPDLHPTVLASAEEGADGVAGLGAGLTPRGPSFALLMLKNQTRMNQHKENCWGGGKEGKTDWERGGKRMEGEEKRGEKKLWGMMGTQGDTEVRGWVMSTEKPPGQEFGVQGINLSTLPTTRIRLILTCILVPWNLESRRGKLVPPASPDPCPCFGTLG